MPRLRSLVKWLFSSRYAQPVEEDRSAANSTPPSSLFFNPLCILRGDYELMAGAVAIVRTELPNGRHERAYYPEQASDFYSEVVASLANNHRVTVQTNLDPECLGIGRDNEGRGKIVRRPVLG